LGTLSQIGRFFVVGALLKWYLLRYGVGRIGTLFIRDREARRRAVARLRGRILRQGMTRLGATFVKLGQVLSTRRDLLERETIDELRKLQDRLPPFPVRAVRTIVEADLGGTLEDHFAELDELPVAAASVAQVHRARTRDGDEVAVKVLRPDVREKVQRDAGILLAFAKMGALIPKIRLSDPVGHLRQFIAGILEQTDLRLEQRNYDRFRRCFADVEGVRFPRVFSALSGERVMTMEFLRGTKIDALPPGDHHVLAKRLQRVFMKMCFEDGFVHADLHPGNMLVTESGDLVIFDVGLVKDLPPEILLQFVDFTKCLVMGTPKDFVAHVRRFYEYVKVPDWAELEREVEVLFSHFRGQNLAELEIGALLDDLFGLMRKYQVRPLTELMLVIVAMITAEGMGKQLHPGDNLFESTAEYLGPRLAQMGLELSKSA
jgi:ubiquinone biosynthesis protein